MQRHTWRENTDEGVRFLRASYHASTWKLESQFKGEEDWVLHDPISIEEWKTLREILWRKYQRRRCPWELIARIDKLLEEESEES